MEANNELFIISSSEYSNFSVKPMISSLANAFSAVLSHVSRIDLPTSTFTKQINFKLSTP